MNERGGARGSDRDGMNLVVIEEHQVRDLVFAQIHYLYSVCQNRSSVWWFCIDSSVSQDVGSL